MNYEKMRDVLISAQTTLCYLKTRYGCDFGDNAIDAIESRVGEIDNAVIELDAEKIREGVKTEQHAPEIHTCLDCAFSCKYAVRYDNSPEVMRKTVCCSEVVDPITGSIITCKEARELVGLHCPYFQDRNETKGESK